MDYVYVKNSFYARRSIKTVNGSSPAHEINEVEERLKLNRSYAQQVLLSM